MCGIAGYTGPEIPSLIDRMISAVRSRGPDGENRFSGQGVHFGHTRLSILDIERGSQPMTRGNGRFTVCYNGEIYNFDELRSEIETAGLVFTTTCDTEILPLGFSLFGESLFGRLNGMFAFALYDRDEGSVYLVRDHLGIKPLYYAEIGGNIVFSSSARAVALSPNVSRDLDPQAVGEFLQFRYVRSGKHMFRDVKQLAPGSFVKWSPQGITVKTFWEPRAARSDKALVPDETVEKTEALIERTVQRQLRSDVPMGIFLSGGLDSSLVGHVAGRHSDRPITAFTFDTGDGRGELEAAGEAASEFGFAHRIVRLQEQDFVDLPDAIGCMDNPVGDAIVLPIYALCRAAATEVKTVLTGEGADEMFGGYVHFPVLMKLGRMSGFPFLGQALAPLVKGVTVSLLDRFFDYPSSLGKLGRERVAKMLRAIGNPGRLAALASQVITDSEIGRATLLPPPPPRASRDLSLRGLMLDSTRDWLPNQILHKMDQLSMAFGLEARVPYVDPDLYDALAGLPDRMFIDNGENKVLLRRVAAKMGLNVAKRKKIAFHLPLERSWRDIVLSLSSEWLSDDALNKHRILRPEFVGETLAAYKEGEFVAAKRLIAMMTLHMWLDKSDARL